ncbi:MAG: hypothetical protein DRP66_08200 [Planctomycetota bacterium]|nr:MAG: hypothetical protein DRP66_08200 [Planctomycetota bacterium]
MNRICAGNEYCFLLLSVVIGFVICGPARAEFIADGVTLVPLTNDGKSAAIAWAPHGDKILYQVLHTDTQRQLFVADSNGANAEAITPIGFPYYAQWSWAGDKVAFLYANSSSGESQARAYIYDLNSKKTVMACEPYPRFNLDEDEGPLWSPDDRYIVFKTRRGPSRRRFVTVYDTQTKNRWDILPQRGQNRRARWNFTLPPRLAFQSEAAGEHYDIAVSDPEGDNAVFLTAIGAEAVNNIQPRWRPPGAYEDMIAYTSNLEMTRTERDIRRNDVWIARPDGSETRNLTQATSPSTEEQLNNDFILWSWDGRWILSRGDRFDSQGNDIHAAYLVDPVNGGYRILFTTFPRKDGLYERTQVIKWSYDSTRLLMYTQRYDVKNWDADRQYQRTRHVLSLLHVDTGLRDEILVCDEELERRKILGSDKRRLIEDISYSPDGRSILLSIATVLSREDMISRPNVYRLDLPESLVGPQASRHDGPPVGRKAPDIPADAAAETTLALAEQTKPVPESTPSQTPTDGPRVTVLTPQHMTVDEVMELLPTQYSRYLTTDTSRNFLLFEGPESVLSSLKENLRKIDTNPSQILVDLLAVELTEEANRSLGLDWTYAQGHFGLYQPMGNAIRDLSPASVLGGLSTFPGAGQVFYQGVGTLPSEFFVRVNALVQDGKGTILANPRTVAMSGREAVIKIRKTLNYFFNEGFDVSGRPIVKKSDISAETQGRITPTLLADGRIHMEVNVMAGSFTFTPDAGLPEQIDREAATTVRVSEGETLVIGGLRQQEMSESVVKIPLLGDLPLLGFLFKKKEKETRSTVLTLFITPHIMRQGSEAPPWPEVNLDDGHRITSPDTNRAKP